MTTTPPPDSILAEYTCPVCQDNLVGPYCLPCGHTICVGCFPHMRTNTCPLCRAEFSPGNGNGAGFGINIMLSNLLRHINPNYEEEYHQKAEPIHLQKLMDRYHNSRRFHDYREVVGELLLEKSYITLDDLYVEFESDCEQEELHYIIDCLLDSDVIDLFSLKGEHYVIWTGPPAPGGDDPLIRFAREHSADLRDDPISFIRVIKGVDGRRITDLCHAAGLPRETSTRHDFDDDSNMPWLRALERVPDALRPAAREQLDE